MLCFGDKSIIWAALLSSMWCVCLPPRSCSHARTKGAPPADLWKGRSQKRTGSRNGVRFDQRKPVYRAALSRSIAFWVESYCNVEKGNFSHFKTKGRDPVSHLVQDCKCKSASIWLIFTLVVLCFIQMSWRCIQSRGFCMQPSSWSPSPFSWSWSAPCWYTDAEWAGPVHILYQAHSGPRPFLKCFSKSFGRLKTDLEEYHILNQH